MVIIISLVNANEKFANKGIHAIMYKYGTSTVLCTERSVKH